MFHESRRPVHSIGAVKVLAAVEAIEELKTWRAAFCSSLMTTVLLFLFVDYKDMYMSFSTQRRSIDCLFMADVELILVQARNWGRERNAWDYLKAYLDLTYSDDKHFFFVTLCKY